MRKIDLKLPKPFINTELLAQIIECMLDLAVIDKELTDQEMDIIIGFAKENLQNSIKPADVLVREIAMKIANYKKNGFKWTDKFISNLKEIEKLLRRNQKSVIVDIMDELMVADRYISSEERRLFNTFKSVLMGSNKNQ